MNTRIIVHSVLVCAALMLGACHRTVDSVQVGAGPDGTYNWISTDSGLRQAAAVVGARKSKADDLLRVQVEVQNLRSQEQRIFYKFEWYEPDGMLVQSPTPVWLMKIIEGKEQVMLQGIAPNPRVVDCRLKLQENTR